jgi:hypothetical protein
MAEGLFVDRRCGICRDAGKTDAYRMTGGCYNCGTAPILGLFTAGHEKGGGKCPVCGCERLHWDRLATADEIPADFEEAGRGPEPR